MKNKILNILSVITLILLVSGCSNKYGIDTSKYSTKNLEYTKCVRNAETTDDSKMSINYKLYSDKKGYLKVMISTEKLVSSDKELLKQYKEAYEKVYAPYKNIKYYENKVIQEKNSLISKTYINYGKVDMNKIIKIEGEENNVKITNGKIKLRDWKKFAKKYGAMCY